ncbi:PEP-CTERM sorting domain-containing protein [Sedimentisphaera salicampi]|uniref:PEP-CTERM protein-sorting domain-containing protein n=1 Tax=Sedimentisphaera salicampi TaxID=1941349 RepID=A0A1W6LLA7_9BACT|nr:PEP-CTERM sorting domain-containing protein [Sedimentisphaera salicampi]ARN56551.1 hypothetical protein STSP1_00934 [Sedimentisphaera salicampi]
MYGRLLPAVILALLTAASACFAGYSDTGGVSQSIDGSSGQIDWENINSSGSVYIGYYGFSGTSSATIDSGSSVDVEGLYIGYDSDNEGTLTLSGQGTEWNSGYNDDAIGGLGKGTLNVLDGAAYTSLTSTIIGNSNQGTVVVDNATFEIDSYLYLNKYSSDADNSSLTVTGGGTASAQGLIDIRYNSAALNVEDGSMYANEIFVNSSAVININIGLKGSLELGSASSTQTISDFLANGFTGGGSYDLKIWNDGSYADYSSLTENADYKVEDGVLFVPEPATFSLLFLGGAGLIRRR